MRAGLGRSARAALLLALAVPALHAAEPAAGDFAWQAPIEVPAGAPLARVAVPAEALALSRSRVLADLRVFDAQGRLVPYAIWRPAPPAAQAVYTAPYPALPLLSLPASATAPQGAVRVQVEGGRGAGGSVWVQVDGAAPAASAASAPAARARLPAALFDLREEKERIEAIELDATLAANIPVRVRASTSPDLARWSPLPLRGSLYRFEQGGPSNRVLELEAPASLHGRYLRLEWDGATGLEPQSLRARVAGAPAPQRVLADLPAPREVDGALEWTIPFATPVAALALQAQQPNTLLPVRVLVRSESSQRWQPVAQAAVYRLGVGEQETRNPAVAFGGRSLPWLRVEATQPGATLARDALRAGVEFDPVEVVFAAGAPAPLRLAIGRAGASPAAVALATLETAAGKPPSQLPQAMLGPAQVKTPDRSRWAALLPEGTGGRDLALWAVLGIAVVTLALVAGRLLAQIGRP